MQLKKNIEYFLKMKRRIHDDSEAERGGSVQKRKTARSDAAPTFPPAPRIDASIDQALRETILDILRSRKPGATC